MDRLMWASYLLKKYKIYTNCHKRIKKAQTQEGGACDVWFEKGDFYATLEKEFASSEEKNPAVGAQGWQLDSLLLICFGSGGCLILGLLIKGRRGESSRVEGEVRAADVTDWLDISGACKMHEQSSGNSSINLELFHDDWTREAENLGHFCADLVESLLVQEDVLVELVLNLGLGPGLLLCLGSLQLVSLGALGGARTLIFSR